MNVQHDCIASGCNKFRSVQVVQERIKTSQVRSVASHEASNHFVLNAHSLHNYQHIKAAVPPHLRRQQEPEPNDLEVTQLRKVAAGQVRQMKKARTKAKHQDDSDTESEQMNASAMPLPAFQQNNVTTAKTKKAKVNPNPKPKAPGTSTNVDAGPAEPVSISNTPRLVSSQLNLPTPFMQAAQAISVQPVRQYASHRAPSSAVSPFPKPHIPPVGDISAPRPSHLVTAYMPHQMPDLPLKPHGISSRSSHPFQPITHAATLPPISRPSRPPTIAPQSFASVSSHLSHQSIIGTPPPFVPSQRPQYAVPPVMSPQFNPTFPAPIAGASQFNPPSFYQRFVPYSPSAFNSVIQRAPLHSGGQLIGGLDGVQYLSPPTSTAPGQWSLPHSVSHEGRSLLSANAGQFQSHGSSVGFSSLHTPAIPPFLAPQIEYARSPILMDSRPSIPV